MTSIYSQPCDSHTLLQVPDVSPVHPRSPLNLIPPRIALPTPSLSPRSLRRQVRDPISADISVLTSFRMHPWKMSRWMFPLQGAVKVDSVESQSCERQERPNPVHLPPSSPSPLSPHTSSPSHLNPPPPSSPSTPSIPPCSPPVFPLPPSSPLPPFLSSPSPLPPLLSSPSLLLPPPPSPRLPLRPPSLRRPRPPSAASFCDPADEEVSHITSSAEQRWKDEAGGVQESRGKTGRSHSLSPYTTPYSLDSASPLPPPLPPSSSRSALSLLGTGLKDRDFRKGFSVDNKGFLDKPSSLSAGYPEDQRRHSIEVCLPPDILPGDDQPFKCEAHRSEKGGQAFPVRVKSVGGGHRKKKMSPPCISIHPPSEREPPQIASPPKLADCSMMLRRRTPSYDLTPHTQSNMQDPSADSQMRTPMHSPMHTTLTPVHVPLQANSPTHTLTPPRASTPTHSPTYTPPHASTPTHPHIPISPNIFIQPHAPLLPNAMPFPQTHSLSPTARRSPVTGDYMPRPQFTFDQPQSRYMSGLSAGLSDTETATCSSPFDNRLGSGTGFSAKNRRTAQWTLSIAFRNQEVDELVQTLWSWSRGSSFKPSRDKHWGGHTRRSLGEWFFLFLKINSAKILIILSAGTVPSNNQRPWVHFPTELKEQQIRWGCTSQTVPTVHGVFRTVDTPGLKPPNSVAKVFLTHCPHPREPIRKQRLADNLWPLQEVVCEMRAWEELCDMQLQVLYRSSACPSSAPRSHWSQQKCVRVREWACLRFLMWSVLSNLLSRKLAVLFLRLQQQRGGAGQSCSICLTVYLCSVNKGKYCIWWD